MMYKLKRHRIPDYFTCDKLISVELHEMVKPTSQHWHDYYEVEVCLAGEGETAINDVLYPLKRGVVSVLTPSDFHVIRPFAGQTVKLLNLSFAPSCIEKMGGVEKVDLRGAFAASDAALERLCGYLATLGSETKSKRADAREYADHLLGCILAELSRLEILRESGKSAHETKESASVRRMICFAHAHFAENITLAEAAEAAKLSSGYAGKLFRKEMGESFTEFVTHLRLEQAKRLLTHTEATVTEISYFCGFGSVTHFLRVFKKEYNESPGAFRKKPKI